MYYILGDFARNGIRKCPEALGSASGRGGWRWLGLFFLQRLNEEVVRLRNRRSVTLGVPIVRTLLFIEPAEQHLGRILLDEMSHLEDDFCDGSENNSATGFNAVEVLVFDLFHHLKFERFFLYFRSLIRSWNEPVSFNLQSLHGVLEPFRGSEAENLWAGIRCRVPFDKDCILLSV